MSTHTQDVAQHIAPYLQELVDIRQDIHRHPELGLKEVRTSQLVADKLREWGIETDVGMAGTGVVGIIRGNRPGQRTIGLRADMDALPIIEETGVPYASETPGIMHACGHDGHTTMLLGAARYLAETRDFAGTVILIFQPGEEGCGGARKMVEDGLFEKYPCDAIYGMHNRPGMPLGQIGCRPGPIMAAGSWWQVKFKGTGGHGGGWAYKATDVTVAGGNFLAMVHSIISRNIPSSDTAVVSVGHVSSGVVTSPNVMPAEFLIAGIVRTFDSDINETMKRRITEIANGCAAMQGCEAEVTYWHKTYGVTNEAEQTKVATAAAQAVVGIENVMTDIPQTTGGEDFSEMMRVVPGTFSWIGNGTAPDGSVHIVHTPKYNFNDEAIPFGIRFWAEIVHTEMGMPA
ncbi:amidohydrolase [Falsirhodobacter sp. alg1]|uniref:amidohydrolase n=1 Tax=Falsirhodobacter sp. alg1 TaxID=1472418 RepID=UPI0005EE5A03|nr:amidohydrolase [Falsirhodobacter sp. alg1]